MEYHFWILPTSVEGYCHDGVVGMDAEVHCSSKFFLEITVECWWESSGSGCWKWGAIERCLVAG